MAIWQFAVELIPQAWTKLKGNVPEMLYDGEGCNDTSTAWKQNQPGANLIDLIAQVLPPTESWTDTIRIFGDQTRSDIQVSYEGNTVESVMVRIDTRDDTLDMCSKIVDLARALDCFFFLPAARAIITADVTALGDAVYNSSAARFSAAPREFIEQFSRVSSNES